MTLLGPDGRPAGAPPPQQQAAQLVGFCIVKKLPGNLIDVVRDAKGIMMMFLDVNVAKQHATNLANQELLPNKDQKVVTPQMKSSEYIVIGMLALAMVQASIKNPEQLLAPAQGKVPS